MPVDNGLIKNEYHRKRREENKRKREQMRRREEEYRWPKVPPPQPVSAWEWWFMTLLMTAVCGFAATHLFGLGNWVIPWIFVSWVVIGSGVR